MAESFGMNINMSLVSDKDGNYSMGIHYDDSEGIDVESKGEGDDWSELVTGLFTDIFDDILKQKQEKEKKVEETPEEKITRLMDEIQSLKIDNEILKQRLEPAPKEKKINNNKEKPKYDNTIKYSIGPKDNNTITYSVNHENYLNEELKNILKDLGL